MSVKGSRRRRQWQLGAIYHCLPSCRSSSQPASILKSCDRINHHSSASECSLRNRPTVSALVTGSVELNLSMAASASVNLTAYLPARLSIYPFRTARARVLQSQSTGDCAQCSSNELKLSLCACAPSGQHTCGGGGGAGDKWTRTHSKLWTSEDAAGRRSAAVDM